MQSTSKASCKIVSEQREKKTEREGEERSSLKMQEVLLPWKQKRRGKEGEKLVWNSDK